MRRGWNVCYAIRPTFRMKYENGRENTVCHSVFGIAFFALGPLFLCTFPALLSSGSNALISATLFGFMLLLLSEARQMRLCECVLVFVRGWVRAKARAFSQPTTWASYFNKLPHTRARCAHKHIHTTTHILRNNQTQMIYFSLPFVYQRQQLWIARKLKNSSIIFTCAHRSDSVAY